MTEIFNELSVIGAEMNEEDRVVHLLASLPDSYSTLVTALEARPDVPTMDTVIEKLVYEEQKSKDRTGNKSSSTEGAMNSSHHKKKGPRCYNCKRFGHYQQDCKQRDMKDHSSKSSHHSSSYSSRSKNHYRSANCVTSKRRPDDSSESDDVGLVIDHVMTAEASSTMNGKWILDSGATCHICSDRSRFVKLYPLKKNIDVKLGDGHTLEAVGEGTVVVHLKYGQHTRKCSLYNVLYIPNFVYNIISVSKATKRGISFKFNDDTCVIRDTRNRVVTVATRVGGLYELSILPHEVHSAIHNANFTREDLWHYRYGHLSMKNLQKLARDNLIKDFDFSITKEIQFCESCIAGKQHKNPYPSHAQRRSKEALELIHSDVCGKINAKSLSGGEYFLTFTDDKTRFVWVYIIKNKSEVFDKFCEWKRLVEKSTGKSSTYR